MGFMRFRECFAIQHHIAKHESFSDSFTVRFSCSCPFRGSKQLDVVLEKRVHCSGVQ